MVTVLHLICETLYKICVSHTHTHTDTYRTHTQLFWLNLLLYNSYLLTVKKKIIIFDINMAALISDKVYQLAGVFLSCFTTLIGYCNSSNKINGRSDVQNYKASHAFLILSRL